MANLDSIQDFHYHLSVVCTSLEKLFVLAHDEHSDLVDAAEPALLLFRELLDAGAQQGWAR